MRGSYLLLPSVHQTLCCLRGAADVCLATLQPAATQTHATHLFRRHLPEPITAAHHALGDVPTRDFHHRKTLATVLVTHVAMKTHVAVACQGLRNFFSTPRGISARHEKTDDAILRVGS